jgi:Bacterial membrane protein YfhO
MSPPAILQVHSSKLPAKTRTVLAVIVLLGLTLAFYNGLWLPGLVLIKRDAYGLWLPLKQHMIERLAAGELPQWFPYEALGRPFIGTAATGIFHPFTALYFLLPAPDAYRASTLLSCLLAAVGAFTLGRTLNFSRTGALIAGVAFALSGYVVSFTEHLIYLYSICVLPFFCAALEKALVGVRAWAVAPAVVWTTVLLQGDGQTGYYFGFIALLWTAARAPSALPEACLRLLLVGSLAVLLAGVQLAPAALVFLSSNRMQPELFQSEALYWSTHPLRLLTVLAAPVGESANPVEVGRIFFGTPQRGSVGGMLADSLYLGVPMMGLALIGGWHRRDLRLLALLGGFALLLALGRFGGLYAVLYNVVPLWSAFRYPEKWMGVVSFAAAILAGAGIDALRAGKGSPTPWLAMAILCASIWFGLRTEAASAWTAAHFGASESLAGEMTGSAALAFLYSAWASLGVWILILGARNGRLREAVLVSALLAILTLDLGRANFSAYRTGPIEAATFIPPLAQAIATREGGLHPGRFRLIPIRESKHMVRKSLRSLLGQEAESVVRRQALDVEHNAQFHLETTHVSLPGYNRALLTLLPEKPGIEVAARFNVTYFTGPRLYLRDSRYTSVFVAGLSDYDLALYQNPVPAKPRAYLSRRPERVAGPVDPAALLARNDFLNGDVDVIETPEATLPGPSREGTATIEHYALEKVRVRVETPQPTVLILLDAFDQGWTATLESGGEVPILRANVLVRAVVVPAGKHVVTFRYETPLLRAGAAGSLTGTLICLGLIARARWGTRKNQSTS